MSVVLFFKHKTSYELRISDWSSDVCSSDLEEIVPLLSGKRALLVAILLERDIDCAHQAERAQPAVEPLKVAPAFEKTAETAEDGTVLIDATIDPVLESLRIRLNPAAVFAR